MLLDVSKNGITYHGISEEEAISKGIHFEYLTEKIKCQYQAAVNSRRLAYDSESDPLYMEWQYDQTPESEQAWRDKVTEIKQRYPLSTES